MAQRLRLKKAPGNPANPKAMSLHFQKAQPEELKAIGDEIPDGFIAGWASTPDLDSYRDVVLPGAFDAAIASRGLSGPRGIKLLLGHDWSKTAGAITKLETRGGRLWIEAQLNLEISYAKDAYEAIKATNGMSFSIGFYLQEYNIRQDSEGRDYFELVKGDLFEVSVVPFPANSECVMEFFKSDNPDYEEFSSQTEEEDEEISSLSDFEKMLVNSGLVKSRNDAKFVTLAVKDNIDLFKKKEQVPAPEAPVAEVKSIESLLGPLAELKSLLSSRPK